VAIHGQPCFAYYHSHLVSSRYLTRNLFTDMLLVEQAYPSYMPTRISKDASASGFPTAPTNFFNRLAKDRKIVFPTNFEDQESFPRFQDNLKIRVHYFLPSKKQKNPPVQLAGFNHKFHLLLDDALFDRFLEAIDHATFPEAHIVATRIL
jgi:hypothetical protein